MAGNSNLSAAVKAKKDEFYTQLTDIENESRHIVPWSRGGKTTPNNCQMLCRDCNLKKGAQE